jgi:hypothetical protein
MTAFRAINIIIYLVSFLLISFPKHKYLTFSLEAYLIFFL